MTEDELKALLNSDRMPLNASKGMDEPLDLNVKRQTISLALAEFEDAQQEKAAQKKNPNIFQGIWQGLRPIFESQKNTKDKPMKKQMWIYSSLGTACVVMLGVMFVKNQPTEFRVPTEISGGNVVSDVGVTPDNKEVPLKIKPPIENKRVTQEQNQNNNQQSKTVVEEANASEPIRQSLEDIVVTGTRKVSKEALASKRQKTNTAMDQARTNSVQGGGIVQTTKMNAPALSSYSSSSADKRLLTPQPVQQSRDEFEKVGTNPIKLVKENPVSTFSIDVDTASYSFVRRQLNRGVLPQKNAVRIEEMVNYFDYDYPLPTDKKQPFETTVVVNDSPWAEGKKLMHIGIKGYDVPTTSKPKTNLVFLLDVSGSMNNADKLPLVKQSMNLLLSQLNPTDTVAIVVYAGAAGTVLEPTQVKDSSKIIDALNKLNAGGSTAGAQGIELAYDLAERNFDKNAINRIILATDGDFNVGINDREQLKGFVERKRKKGVYLSILGFGQGNYNDHLMQTLAQNGNGVAAYIDSFSEAQKVLVNEATSTLFPIAKDVKIQVEFNSATVKEYRLIGYETRSLNREDFNNDKVDAGDIGSGHTVTAIYEITPVGSNAVTIDDLRYQKNDESTPEKVDPKNEYAFVKIRYKLPDENTSKLIERVVSQENSVFNESDTSMLLKREIDFSTAVVAFAQQLKNDKYLSAWDYQKTLDLAQANKGPDEFGYRTEFVQLVRKAMIAKNLNTHR